MNEEKKYDVPKSATCPACLREFELEPWRAEDGPCMDGKWYCLKGGDEDCWRCGCMQPRNRD